MAKPQVFVYLNFTPLTVHVTKLQKYSLFIPSYATKCVNDARKAR